MTKEEKNACLKVLALPVIIPANIALDAFVLTKLWAWFIVPGFGVAQIGMKTAAGVGFIVALTAHQAKSHETPFAKLLGYHFLAPLLTLLMAYIVKSL